MTTAAELLTQVDATVAALRRAAVEPGDAVALAVPSGPNLATAFLGTMSAATCAPLAADRPVAEHARDLAAVGARVLVVERGHDTPAREAAAALRLPVAELVAEPGAGRFTLGEPVGGPPASARRDLEGVALLLFTSGATSRPKLVPLTEANLVASAAHGAAPLALTPADRCLGVMPLFHIHGLVAGLLAPLLAGGSVVCTPGFAGSAVWQWRGEAVAFVGLADVVHPELLRARWRQRHSARYRLRKLLSRKGPRIVAWRVRQVFGRNPPRPVVYLPGTAARLDWGAAAARERAYFPRPLSAPLVVFATRGYVDFAGTPDLGWGPLMQPGSESIVVPGDHDSMIGEPHVHVLAARLAESLGRADGGAGIEVSDDAGRRPRPAGGRTPRSARDPAMPP